MRGWRVNIKLRPLRPVPDGTVEKEGPEVPGCRGDVDEEVVLGRNTQAQVE